MKQFKTWLMLVICIIISSKGFSQTLSFTVQVPYDECDTISINPNSGYLLDSIQILSDPLSMVGGITASTNNYLVYCTDYGQVGNDTAVIYACQHGNGVSYGCDTFVIIFHVSANNNVLPAFGEQYFENQCDTFSYDPNTGYTLDSVQILTSPADGNVSFILGQFVQYCPNSNFTGPDSMQIYACQNANGVSYGCDTFEVYLNVQQAGFFSVGDTIPVTENQCDTFAMAPAVSLDSFQLINPPVHGTVNNGSFLINRIYCPDSGFVGYDSIRFYACASENGQFLFCDTFELYFNVQPFFCSLSVSLIADSGCQNGGQHYTAEVNSGASPFTYAWADGTIGTGDCQLNTGQSLCVTVTDANGCTAAACVNNNGCSLNVAITLDSTVCNGQPGLTITASGGTVPYQYYWSTGAITDTLCGLNGGLLAGGDYCVDVVDSYGCFGYTCYNVTGPGACSFQYVQTNADSQTIAFYGSYDSTFSHTSVSWSFGDGTGSNVLNPVHNYVNYGTYYVTMNLYYTNGDSCSSTQYIYVYSDSTNNYPYCQAYFSSYVSNDTVYFTDQSVYNPVTWQWDFGDGTGSTQQNPYHVYNSQGTWNVCLTITDTSGVGVNGTTGCSSSYCALTSNVSVQDMAAYLYHGSTVTPGYPLYVYLEYYNNGTELMNGTVVYRYPAGTTLSYAYPTPVTNDPVNRLLTFSYDSILPGASNFIGVSLAADSNLALGSLVYDTMWVYPIVGDVTPANNISTIIDSVVGSWDPNGKSVSPKGRGEKGLIDASTPTVSYMIHFQNTGNAAAHQVIVRDTISDNIDMASVRVTYASFAYVSQIIDNQLVVSFENINLPDTGTSLLASQGYISVMANLKPGLAGGTQILNTANIYFDANAPVITNTVVNTLPGGILGINSIGNLEFTIMPNPANREVLIRGEFDNTSTYELDDMLGRQLLQGRMSTTGAELNVDNMSAGVYIVKVTSGDKTGAQRLVVVR